MSRKILAVLCSIAGLFLVSCREDVTLEIPPYESKLAVFCILQPDQTMALLLSRSKSYFGIADTSKDFEYITDALVVITDLTEGIKDTLTVRDYGSGYWVLNNELFQTAHPRFVSDTKPKIGHKYKLEIWCRGEFLHAETLIPKPVKINTVTYTKSGSAVYEGYNNLYFTIKFDDIAGEANAYSTIIFCGGDFNDFNYLYDNNKDGKELTEEYNIIMSASDTGFMGFKIENQTIETAAYITSVYKQSQFLSHFIAEPSVLNHNITGGLGIFGAASRDSLYFLIQVK